MTTKTAPAALDLAAVHASLVASIQNLIQSNDWISYLKMQARFHRYSFQNTMWLHLQAAERGVQPVAFAGFQSWKKMGRFVKAGEKSFKVLAPVFVKKAAKDESEDAKFFLRGFKIVSTFEKSQTDGKEVAEIVKKLQGTSEEILAAYAKVESFAQTRGWTVSRGDAKGANGYADLVGKAIVVSDTLSDLQALKTLTHEVAHSLMHADDLGSHGAAEREVEAESVAFIVMTALGFDSADYSFGYVAHWSKGDVELVQKTGERVQKAAKAILDGVGQKAEESEEA